MLFINLLLLFANLYIIEHLLYVPHNLYHFREREEERMVILNILIFIQKPEGPRRGNLII